MKSILILVSFFTVFAQASSTEVADSQDWMNLYGSPSFKAVLPTLINKCASCHQHQAWNSFSEEDYFSGGLLNPGFIESSKIYYRLDKAESGPGPRNMKDNLGSSVTDEEVELIKNWIYNF